MVPKLSKIVSFLQFLADVRKKSKAAIAIHAYAPESSPFALSENGIDYYAMTSSLEDISVWSLLSQHFFDILLLNISWTVAQSL